MTAALEGGEWSAARPGRTLPPGKIRYPFYRRLGEDWQLVTDISGKSIGPIFFLTLEDGTDRFSWNVCNLNTNLRCVTWQKNEDVN